MKKVLRQVFPLLLILVLSCTETGTKQEDKTKKTVLLSLEQANQLAELPLACMQKEYPNKLGQTLGSADQLKEPKVLHPAFYGCFDWHSAVHGHWSLIRLLKDYPNLDKATLIREKLQENISREHILEEVNYFQEKHSTSYERTYGWGWLLKLAEEIHSWEDPLARQLEKNLQPLTDLIVARYLEFLPKLLYPIRVGEHTNTAFGLCFAWDYARTLENKKLEVLIADRAMAFYSVDKNCPLDWEPSGFDFLSPCLEEIDLMRRIFDPKSFLEWMEQFAPQMASPDFQLPVGEVSDRSDGKLVHLDGLNFSRAWVLYGLSGQFAEYKHLRAVADKHMNYSLPQLIGDSYEGGHWLGSFALYALTNS
jgi:hypothetical protein